MTQTTLARPPRQELERARDDYLAVSRSGHLYASEDEHLRAERAAWERLERALSAVREAAETRD